MGSNKEESTVAAMASPEVRETVPAFAWYTDHILFHRIWNRPNLPRRDRSIVTVSALVACGNFVQLTGHWGRALDNGISPNEIAELITHLAFQAGWPNAMSALQFARAVFEERGIPVREILQPTGCSIDLDTASPNPFDAIKQPFRKDPFTAALADGIEAIVEEDVWNRSGLALRERSLATLSCMIASGNNERLLFEARRGLENDLTLAELCELVLHLGYYIGLPKAKIAARILDPLGAIARV